jgi:hypothetical protein
VQLRDFAKAGVHPTIGLTGADIAIKGQFYPTTRDDSEMTADAFSLLGWGVSASAVNQSSDCPESANGIGDRMTQRQGICQDIY